jgi:hypothetical protein
LLDMVAMVISRCAWHPFFRGYPRPLRVVSWRGPRIAFMDTICPSCAARVRIEGLWGAAPPTPVWPGSAQTALLFVGLPVLTALLLMATPLHDVVPPPADEAPAAGVREPDILAAALSETGGADAIVPPPRPPTAPRAVRRRPSQGSPVPDVIFETRRVFHVPREARRLRDASTAPRLRTGAPPPASGIPAIVVQVERRLAASEVYQSP